MGQENQIVMVGTGLLHAVEVDVVPTVGDELNLASQQLPGGGGRYKVLEVTEIEWEGNKFPHVLIERVGTIPAGESTLPYALLNC